MLERLDGRRNPVAKNLPYLPLCPRARRKRGATPTGCGGLNYQAPAGQIISANTIIIYDVCCYFTDLVEGGLPVLLARPSLVFRYTFTALATLADVKHGASCGENGRVA